jgi:sialate O-acetylesterase
MINFRSHHVSTCALFVLVFWARNASAKVELPSILAEHMVLQSDLPVHIWGNADPGEQVSVEFRGKHSESTANWLGQWSIYLPPDVAGGPFQLLIHGTNTINTFRCFSR